MTRRSFMLRLMRRGGLLYGTWIGLKYRAELRSVPQLPQAYPGKLIPRPVVLGKGKWVG